MTTSQVSVHVCLKITDLLSEYRGYSSNSKYMGPYRGVNVAIFLTIHSAQEDIFDVFSPMVMKNNPSVF